MLTYLLIYGPQFARAFPSAFSFEDDPCSAKRSVQALLRTDIFSSILSSVFASYCWKTGGGPPTRRHFSRTFTSTRLAILMKGMPLVMPYSLRSKAMVPSRLPVGVPLLSLVRVSFSVLVTPRIVKLPSMSNVFGPVWTIFVDWKVIKGDSFALKKSCPFNLLSFTWLPVLTLSASISISKTALLISLDENLMLAFHFSKTPLIETEESTPNLILLSTGVNSYVGTCA